MNNIIAHTSIRREELTSMKILKCKLKLCIFASLSMILSSHTNASNDNNNISRFYETSKSGKIIDFVGDSTTEAAPELYNRISQRYAVPGGPLEGATVKNSGTSGNTLRNFVNNISANGNTMDKVVQDKADLYIVSYGINDIRGSLEKPGRSPAEINADLKIAIDRLLNETNGYILLRIPNTLLTGNSNSINLWPGENAQQYSDQLWDVYESFKGYNERIDIIDIPSLVFGRTAVYEHPLMHDILHPNGEGYNAIADAIVDRINGKTKDINSPQTLAQETPVNKTITILREEKLYNGVPDKSGVGSKYTGAAIAPQSLNAIAQMKGFYKINTWMGDKWIIPVSGVLEVAPSSDDETLLLTANTFVLDNPYAVNIGREGSVVLTPQKVKVLGKWNGYTYWRLNWFYIQTWLGPKWVNPKYASPVDLQPTKETIEIKNITDLNKYPWPDAYKLGKIAPQKVAVFEKGNGWYHIHSWAGDAWIGGNS
jgi:lysophospholipase L1-like esterase